MKHRFILFFLFLIPMQAFCFNEVNKDKFKEKIHSLRYFLSVYDTLSTFSGNQEKYDLIITVREEITNRLLEILNNPKIAEYNIYSLLRHPSLNISSSEDQDLFLFSFDEKTGGSNRTNINIIYFRMIDGNVKAEIFGNDSDYFGGCNLDQIFIVDKAKHIYLTSGGVITGNSTFAQLAITIEFDSTGYRVGTVFSFTGYSGIENITTFEFSPETKEFNYEYWIDDPENNLEREIFYPGFRKRVRGKLRYYDGNFIPVEHCEYWEQNGR